MGKAEKISISLTDELLAEVHSAVASGHYASISEVVREALRTWREQRSWKEAAIAELKLLIAEAEASGYNEGPLDVSRIIREGHRRLAEQHE